MSSREWMHEAGGEPTPTNLVLKGSPNWTAVVFLGGLGALHLSIWTLAVGHSHGEAYMSLVFGCAFLLAALACYLSTFEITVIPSERRVRVRSGFRRMRMERSIAFSQIRAVRLTLTSDPDHASGRVELLCGKEDILCPSTPVARVEALCLAVTLGVRLIKVMDGQELPVCQRTRSTTADELPAN